MYSISVIINQKAQKVQKTSLQNLSFHYPLLEKDRNFFITESFQHLNIAVDKILESQSDIVVILGGDGTFHFVANALYKKIPVNKFPMFYLIPAGTINTIVWQLYKNKPFFDKLITSVQKNKELKIIKMPILNVNNTIAWLYGSGVGVEILEKYYTHKGSRGYKAAIYSGAKIAGRAIKNIFEDNRIEAKYIVDNQQILDEKILFMLASTLNYPFPYLKLTPQYSIPNDSFSFHAVSIKQNRFFIYLPNFFSGRKINNKSYKIFNAKKIKIEFNNPSPYLLDGELYPEAKIHSISQAGFIKLIGE